MLILPLGPESEDLEEKERRSPRVTQGLVVALVLAYAFLVGVAPLASRGDRLLAWGYRPDLPPGLGVLTYQLIHGDVVHLVGNCIFLAGFGAALEGSLGPMALFLVFLATGAAGALAHGWAAVPPAPGVPPVPLVGASGSIMGLVGALLPTAPWLRIRLVIGIYGWWRIVAVQAWGVAVGFLLKEAALAGFYGTASNVSYAAHLGGLLSGAVMGLAWTTVFGPVAVPSGKPRSIPSGAIATGPDPSESPASDGPRVEITEAELYEAQRSVEDLVLPIGKDLRDASSLWAQSMEMASLQDRFRRARSRERDPTESRVAFKFYLKVLEDPSLAGHYRAYAGARASRMLLRSGRFDAALRLAERILVNKLPGETQKHLEATREAAREAVARKRGRRPGN